MHSYVMMNHFIVKVSHSLSIGEFFLMIPETGIMLFMYYNLSPTDHYYMKGMLQKGHER